MQERILRLGLRSCSPCKIGIDTETGTGHSLDALEVPARWTAKEACRQLRLVGSALASKTVSPEVRGGQQLVAKAKPGLRGAQSNQRDHSFTTYIQYNYTITEHLIEDPLAR